MILRLLRRLVDAIDSYEDRHEHSALSERRIEERRQRERRAA